MLFGHCHHAHKSHKVSTCIQYSDCPNPLCHLVSTWCNSATSRLVCDGSFLDFWGNCTHHLLLRFTLVTLLTIREHRLACHRFAFFHLPAITCGSRSDWWPFKVSEQHVLETKTTHSKSPKAKHVRKHSWSLDILGRSEAVEKCWGTPAWWLPPTS